MPPQPEPANLNLSEMREAIPKLEKRIIELESFNIDSLTERYDPRIEALENKIDDTLVTIFGKNSIEYERYSISSLDHAPHIIGGIPLPEAIEGIKKGFRSAVTKLKSIIEIFEEKLEEHGENPKLIANRLIKDICLHPELQNAVWKLFEDGHYANAIEDGCKVLESFVKIRSGKYDLHGTELMQNVFSPKNPILKFNELITETDLSEQQGMMFLYAGLMLALRNPRVHGIIEDNPDTAVEILLFINFLMKSLDKTNK
jgi:uncharacterized protein (TIGR02391 family)